MDAATLLGVRLTAGRTAVLIPAAPRDDVADTVDSVLHFEPDALVVVLHDGDGPLDVDERAVVLPPLPWPRNAHGGLWCKDAYGLDWVLRNSAARVVLRLDADAVFVRSGAFELAQQRFQQDAQLGALGSFQVRHDGDRRDFTESGATVNRHCGVAGIRFPRTRASMRALRAQALQHGYVPGAHALGAALFLRREMLEAWQRRGWLQSWELAPVRMTDDVIMGLLTYAAGFRIGDFGEPGGVVAAKWRGLPASPEEILDSPACITHSVRSYRGLPEHEIRRRFRERRA